MVKMFYDADCNLSPARRQDRCNHRLWFPGSCSHAMNLKDPVHVVVGLRPDSSTRRRLRTTVWRL